MLNTFDRDGLTQSDRQLMGGSRESRKSRVVNFEGEIGKLALQSNRKSSFWILLHEQSLVEE